MTSDKNLSTSDGQIFVPSDVLVFPSDVLALAIKLVYKSSASTYEKNLSTYEGKFCLSDVVYFCSEFTKSLRNLKIEFSPYKMGQNTLIFSKFDFQKNAQNVLIEVQNNNCILHEKARQMKKTFCFNNCACYSLRKKFILF